MNAIKFTPEMVRAIMAGRKCQTRRLIQKAGAGDKLYIDEPWAYHGSEWQSDNPLERTYSIHYLADGARREIRLPITVEIDALKQNIEYPPGFDDLDPDKQKWVKDDLLEAWWKKMHEQVDAPLPPQFARVILRITGVHQEQLRATSYYDVVAEGFEGCFEFADYWNSIYGNRPGCTWSDNPVVWVHQFEIVILPVLRRQNRGEHRPRRARHEGAGRDGR